MKELINQLIQKSGLNGTQFALAVGTSKSYLCQIKNQKTINHNLLLSWMEAFNIETLESENVKIMLKSK